MSRAALAEAFPDSSDPYDILAWYELRDVYREFRLERISRAEGESRKKAIFKLRTERAEAMHRYKQLSVRLGKFWAQIEEAGSRYFKDRTLENADAFIATVYGVARRTETKYNLDERR